MRSWLTCGLCSLHAAHLVLVVNVITAKTMLRLHEQHLVYTKTLCHISDVAP